METIITEVASVFAGSGVPIAVSVCLLFVFVILGCIAQDPGPESDEERYPDIG